MSRRRRLSRLVGVNQPTRAEPGQHLVQARVRDRETALAATENTEVPDNVVAYVPSAVHDYGPRRGVVVARIEPLKAHRATMLADVHRLSAIGTGRGSLRARHVGKALEPAGVARIRATPVRDEMRCRDT